MFIVGFFSALFLNYLIWNFIALPNCNYIELSESLYWIRSQSYSESLEWHIKKLIRETLYFEFKKLVEILKFHLMHLIQNDIINGRYNICKWVIISFDC